MTTQAQVAESQETEATQSNGFAISEWHDTDEVMARLQNLLSQPIRPIRPENMEKVLKYFEERCQGSKRISDQAKKVIPGGVQDNLAFNYPHPLAITGANGAHMTDVDGNRYIDFLQAGGPTILGSNYDAAWRRRKNHHEPRADRLRNRVFDRQARSGAATRLGWWVV
jgi:glutamate-1-semialdehyde 2,1-aminomutase